jgi:hypothetical protein
MKEGKMYTLRKTGRTNFGVHTGHNSAENIIANRITVFKILTFGPMKKIEKLRDNQLEIREVERRSKQWKRNENGGSQLPCRDER